MVTVVGKGIGDSRDAIELLDKKYTPTDEWGPDEVHEKGSAQVMRSRQRHSAVSLFDPTRASFIGSGGV